ncbi:hypothetical protein [Spirilliplanes yamanashiensis]|uniref:hypothetical protein n=1 Tax=Spirilliplanes yamanashiensis TaxID=42233 RepID=UPI00194F3574|nr:hypothetical protein [Spirilliplanes yamanashiensis]
MTDTTDVTDPRDRRDGIGWVTRAIFPDARLRLRVHRGPAATPAGQRAMARYAVVPSLEHARFLLPLASRRVAAASTIAYNALRPARVRLNRLAVGVLAALGGTGLAGMPVLTVSAPDGADLRELLLTEELGALLGVPLHAAIGVRPPDPHHKPTLQLFDDHGRPRGYAKIGWNDATRALARAEAAALSGLPRGGAGLPAIPRLLRALEWGDRAVTVVEPMPRSVRRISRPDTPRVGAMLAVARRGGPAAAPEALGGSAYLAGLAVRAERAGGPICDLVAALDRRDGATLLEFGDWHGDWVPWNLGEHRGRLVAWDWENRGAGVPVGFDLAHQAFQTALSLRGLDAAGAAAHMAGQVRRHGPRAGLGPDQCRAVADAYLAELWLRTAELAAGGAGWNPRLHPALLPVLAARLDIRPATRPAVRGAGR